MLAIILDMLALDDFEGLTEEIEIAKGRNELNTTVNGANKQYKRMKAWQRK